MMQIKHSKVRRSNVQVRPSRIRRDPPPVVRKEEKRDPAEREIPLVVIGVVLFAVGIAALMFGISHVTSH